MTMEKTKTSKKSLKGLINNSMLEALTALELPGPSKKAKKLLQRNSKKLAAIFANAIKREDKKKKKAEKFMESVTKGTSKGKKSNEVKLAKQTKLAAV